jgi:hypothetical protein
MLNAQLIPPYVCLSLVVYTLCLATNAAPSSSAFHLWWRREGERNTGDGASRIEGQMMDEGKELVSFVPLPLPRGGGPWGH